MSVYRWQRLVLSGEKKRKTSTEVPDIIIVECGTVSNGKRDFPEGKFTYIFGSSSGRIMEFHLHKLVNFVCFIKS